MRATAVLAWSIERAGDQKIAADVLDELIARVKVQGFSIEGAQYSEIEAFQVAKRAAFFLDNLFRSNGRVAEISSQGRAIAVHDGARVINLSAYRIERKRAGGE